ncbi:MAG TPA: hypothetical protein VNJ07_04075 [Chitinophagales bacterium]|nr:hypothetical protein [Chitinophagales bacterium]
MRQYIGKDFVHEGCGLLLDEVTAWEKIAYAARKNIRKTEEAGIRIEKVAGTRHDMEVLRSMWYDPKDPNLPTHLHEHDHMFIAYDSLNEAVGACVLIEVGNHLFLNNLAGNERGKELRIQDYLLWHCVKYFSGSKYKYLDVGVSYRRSLYKFFEKWKVVSYPVIFYKPATAPVISSTPFRLSDYSHHRDEKAAEKALSLLNELTHHKPFTFVPDTQQARSLLSQMAADPIDITFDFPAVKDEICLVDLPQIFPVQFGCLLFNVKIDDQQLWDSYGCLDYYKREIVFTQLASELPKLDEVIRLRRENRDALVKMFSLEDIHSETAASRIPHFYHFNSPVNERFHKKLNEFGIAHFYDAASGVVGLPVHQGLNKNHMEYLYGIYRGVLNLCSEWIHTDKVGSYKNV